jgi:septal ring factor EnvC (AmiA/AmiB activator)
MMLTTLCAFLFQESRMAELMEKSSELNMKNRLLGERNQQLHSLEKDLATKEETIQKFRVQLEEAHLSADQVRHK